MNQTMTEQRWTMLYRALLAGAIGGLVVVTVARRLVPMAEPMAPVMVLRIVALALVTMELGMIYTMRKSVPVRTTGQPFEAWLGAGGARLLTVWVLAEGLILIGAVFWFVTADLVTLLPLALAGLGVLATSPPGKFVA